jgi:membrane-associated phospholipid phosphatase
MTALTGSTSSASTASPSPPARSAAGRALLVSLAATIALALIYVVFVRTEAGQEFDQVGLNHLAHGDASRHEVAGWLRLVTVGAVVLVLGGCLAIAVLRRRYALGLIAVGLVGGANLSTQALKHVILSRPHLGHGWANSLPSGHATIVTSLALAALLVSPRAWRGIVSLVASVAVAVAGVGTVVANWHRPSDVVAAYAICLAWGGLALAVVSLVAPTGGKGYVAHSHPLALVTGLALAAAVFVEVGVRPNGTARDLVIHLVIMCGIAISGALVIGTFATMANSRTT